MMIELVTMLMKILIEFKTFMLCTMRFRQKYFISNLEKQMS